MKKKKEKKRKKKRRENLSTGARVQLTGQCRARFKVPVPSIALAVALVFVLHFSFIKRLLFIVKNNIPIPIHFFEREQFDEERRAN